MKNEIDLKKVLGYKDFEQLQIAATHEKIFNQTKLVDCKSKVFAMDIVDTSQYLATGHERNLILW